MTVLGALLEVGGLVIVAADLESREVRHLGDGAVRRMLRRIAARLGRRRSATVHGLGGTATIEVAASVRAQVRPGDLPAGASPEDRLQRLERYVRLLDEDLNQARQDAKAERREAREEVGDAERRVRAELASVTDELRELAVGGIGWAWRGLLLTAAGVLLSLVGSLTS